MSTYTLELIGLAVSAEKKTPRWAVTVLVAAVLAAPVVAYVATFGFCISGSHARWGEMGSAMSGLYTPILSLLTLGVLVGQARSQVRMNTHHFDQTYIQEARADIEYYLTQLDLELSKTLPDGTSLHCFVNSVFAYARLEDLRSEDVRQSAKNLNRQFPRIFSVWSALCSIFAGLDSQKRYPYESNFVAAKQKAVAIISFETCVALDQYVWCTSEENLKFPFQFSTELPAEARPQ